MVRENVINSVLCGLFIIISIAYFAVLKTDRAFEKYAYGTMIGVNTEPPSTDYYNKYDSDGKEGLIVNVLRKDFYNNFKKESPPTFYEDGNDYNKTLESSSKQNISYYPYSDRDPELLPNHLFLEWYSFADNQFFLLDQKLDYDKILKANKNLRSMGVSYAENYIVASILPNGLVNISMLRKPKIVRESEKYKLIQIQTLKAKPIEKDWNILIKKYSELMNITNKEDLSSLIFEKRKWSFDVQLPKNSRVNTYDMKSFSGYFKEDFNTDFPTPQNLNVLPKSLYLEYSDDSIEYKISYELDGNTILQAYRKLKNLPDKNNIELKLVVNETYDEPKLYLQKGKTMILLKNEIFPTE